MSPKPFSHEGISQKLARSRCKQAAFFGTPKWSATFSDHAVVGRTNKKANLLSGNSDRARHRAIIDGLEAEAYGGEVIRRSRTLLKQMIADLDQLTSTERSQTGQRHKS
jgi:hypothetical protein